MKTLSQLSNEETFARHDDRAKSNRRGFPCTDHCYQPTVDDVAVATKSPVGAAKRDLRAFRKMSEDLMAEEIRHNYVPEIVVLGLVIGIVAWSLISLLIVLAQTANG